METDRAKGAELVSAALRPPHSSLVEKKEDDSKRIFITQG
jgi:hypothetical protein